MSCAAVPMEAAPRFVLSRRALAVFGIVTAITFSAASSAPTPLYRVYQDHFGLSPLMLTVIFGAYAFALLGALLTVGSLSDYVGRRPVTFAALALNAIAMMMFIRADSAGGLVAARLVQGLATGAAITTLGATILDADRIRGPLFNGVTAFVGLTVGSLGAAVLATYAPAPEHLVYELLIVLSLAEAAFLWLMPETAERKAGALASLWPHVRVPPQAVRTLVSLSPVNIAAWALGGFYLSLMPTLVRVVTGLVQPVVGGGVVAILMSTAAAAVVVFRHRVAASVLHIGITSLALGVAVTLIGVRTQSVLLLMFGTLVAGIGFGAAFSATVRTLLPLAEARERAGLLSAFYVQSYLAFSIPAILVGLLAPTLGLPVSAYVYGGVVFLLALSSLVAVALSRTAAIKVQ